LDLKREEVTGGWKKLHNEELCDKDSLANIEVIKTRRIRRVECMACFVSSSWHRCLQSRYFSWFSSFLPGTYDTTINEYHMLVSLSFNCFCTALPCAVEKVSNTIYYIILYILILFILYI